MENTSKITTKEKINDKNDKKGRKKLWKCTFKGCTEPPKTRYNCYSHIWDAHLRHINHVQIPYKKLKEGSKEKEKAKEEIALYAKKLDETLMKMFPNYGIDAMDQISVMNNMNNMSNMNQMNAYSEYNEMNNCNNTNTMNQYNSDNSMNNINNINNINPPVHPFNMNQMNMNVYNENQTMLSAFNQSSNNANIQFGLTSDSQENNLSNQFDQMNSQRLYSPQVPQAMTPQMNQYSDMNINSMNNQMNSNNQLNQFNQMNQTIQNQQMNSMYLSNSSEIEMMNQMNSPLNNNTSSQQIDQFENNQMNQNLNTLNEISNETLSNNQNMLNTMNSNLSNNSNNSNSSTIANYGNGYPIVKQESTSSTNDLYSSTPNINITENNFTSDEMNTSSNLNNNSNTVSDIPQQLAEVMENNEQFIKIETINNSYKRLHVFGDVFSELGYYQRSDERVKENIKPLADSLNKICRMKGVSFNYIGKEEEKYGFIAQEVRKISDNLVIEDENGELAVDVIGIIPLLVNAVNEIREDIESMRDESNDSSDLSDVSELSDLSESNDTYETTLLHSLKSTSNKQSLKERKQIVKEQEEIIKMIDELRTQIEYFQMNVKSSKDEELKSQYFVKLNSNSPKHRKIFFDFSIGPAIVTLFVSIFLTIFSVFVVFSSPEFPFMWGYSWLTTIISYVSLWNTRHELQSMMNGGPLILYFHHNNFISICLLLGLAILGITVSMVMGIIVLIVMTFYLLFFVCLCAILITLRNKYKISFKVIGISTLSYLIAMVIVSYSLFISQPGYSCYINDPSETNYVIDVKLNSEIPKQLFSPLPWNCMKYAVIPSSPLPQGINIKYIANDMDIVPYLNGRVTDLFDTTKIEMYLECASYVKLRCGVVTMKVCEGRTDQESCEANQCNWCNNECKSTCDAK